MVEFKNIDLTGLTLMDELNKADEETKELSLIHILKLKELIQSEGFKYETINKGIVNK